MKADSLKHRLEMLESTIPADDNVVAGPLRLYLYWESEEELTVEQPESNRRCREWTAKHPGAFLGAELEWGDAV